MKQSRYGQVTVMLAFSLFVAYMLPAKVLDLSLTAWGGALAFLILVSLLLFVIRYAHTFYKVVVASLFRLSICLFPLASDFLLVSEGMHHEVSVEPDLPISSSASSTHLRSFNSQSSAGIVF